MEGALRLFHELLCPAPQDDGAGLRLGAAGEKVVSAKREKMVLVDVKEAASQLFTKGQPGGEEKTYRRERFTHLTLTLLLSNPNASDRTHRIHPLAPLNLARLLLPLSSLPWKL